jgi:5-bromo-4-chloroindolyl phosphate hydrolysis protein
MIELKTLTSSINTNLNTSNVQKNESTSKDFAKELVKVHVKNKNATDGTFQELIQSHYPRSIQAYSNNLEFDRRNVKYIQNNLEYKKNQLAQAKSVYENTLSMIDKRNTTKTQLSSKIPTPKEYFTSSEKYSYLSKAINMLDAYQAYKPYAIS